jgi:hypothetical protein
MTNDMRSLNDAEVAAVAGGNPAVAFLAGFVIGAAAVGGAIVGATVGLAIANAAGDDEDEVVIAPGT